MEYFKQNTLAVALIIALTLLNILSISFILLSPLGSGLMGGREHVQSFIENELKLSDLQKKEYDELRLQHFSSGDSMAVIQTAAFETMFALLKSETVDTVAVLHSAGILGSIETTRSIGLFKHFRAIRALCTPEQQKKFDTIIHELTNKLRDRQGPPKPGGK
jgi:periplasmic protein CpxP/Spy